MPLEAVIPCTCTMNLFWSLTQIPIFVNQDVSSFVSFLFPTFKTKRKISHLYGAHQYTAVCVTGSFIVAVKAALTW